MIARGPAFRARHSGRRNVGWSLFLSIAATAFGTSPVFAEDIFGTWMRGDNAARVVIAECGTSICATNIWIRDPDKQHEHVGDRLVFKISHNGDSWTGTAYDPQRDLKFSARLQASGTAMTTKGCMFGGLVCKTTIWARQ